MLVEIYLAIAFALFLYGTLVTVTENDKEYRRIAARVAILSPIWPIWFFVFIKWLYRQAFK